MDTPHMDKMIQELERYDKIGILSGTERAKLNEYREIKQALSTWKRNITQNKH